MTTLDPGATRRDLELMASVVARGDGAVAERLRDLGAAVEDGPSAADWQGVDLFQAFDVNAMAELSCPDTVVSQSLRLVETLRNVLILAPVLVTWYGISRAVSAYHDLVEVIVRAAEAAQGNAAALAEVPRTALLPFLYLWQNGFDGRLPEWLTLSRVALYDSILILLVLGLTMLAYTMAHAEEGRRSADVARTGRRLRATLFDAARILKLRARRPDDHTAGLIEAARTLMIEIRDERERLREEVAARADEVAALHSFATTLKDGSDQLLGAANGLTTLYGDALTRIDGLTTAVAGVATSQTSLTTETASVGLRLADLLEASQTTATMLGSALGAVETAGTVMGAAADGLRDATADIGQAVAQLVPVGAAQTEAAHRIEDATVRLVGQEASLEEQIIRLSDSTVGQVEAQGLLRSALIEHRNELASATDEQRDLVGVIRAVAEALTVFTREQQEVATSLAAALAAQTATTSDLRPAVTAMESVASRLADAETTLLTTLKDEHDRLNHVASVVAQTLRSLEETWQRLADEEKYLFGLGVDVRELRTTLPGFSGALASSMSEVVGAQRTVAEQLTRAGNDVERAAAGVDEIVRGMRDVMHAMTGVRPSPPVTPVTPMDGIGRADLPHPPGGAAASPLV